MYSRLSCEMKQFLLKSLSQKGSSNMWYTTLEKGHPLLHFTHLERFLLDVEVDVVEDVDVVDPYQND